MSIMRSLLAIISVQFVLTSAWGVQNMQTCFSPGENCDKVIVDYIKSATKSIDMAIYSLALDDIHKALLEAKQKGVKIRIVADEEQASGDYSEIPEMISKGFSVRFGSQKGSMHNKFTIVDGKWVETGSYNYSYSASSLNAENQIYLNDPKAVSRFIADFENLWKTGETP
ncbi:phospholipase D-like domain-containing protein [Bdellovibrio sp. HCB337]|uniref:phospholipase D-like domain-containing protein n=1 Tax=Bdellovibrio sp. HCB337 TaxID=3394358 RepID=UPI0039A77CF1